MKPQVQPSRWSCTPTAFAIVLGIDVQDIFIDLGHDGSQKLWRHVDEPSNRRGFHLQEMIDFCYRRGYAVISFEPRPSISSPETQELVRRGDISAHTLYTAPVNFKEGTHERMARIMHGHPGVLSGVGLSGTRHSVAWDGDRIIDPTTGDYIDRERFSIQYVHLVQKLNFGLDVK